MIVKTDASEKKRMDVVLATGLDKKTDGFFFRNAYERRCQLLIANAGRPKSESTEFGRNKVDVLSAKMFRGAQPLIRVHFRQRECVCSRRLLKILRSRSGNYTNWRTCPCWMLNDKSPPVWSCMYISCAPVERRKRRRKEYACFRWFAA